MTDELEQTIRNFCENAVEITLSLNGHFLRQFKNNSSEKRFNNDILSKIEFTEVDVHRSLISNNGDVLFVLDIDHHGKNIEDSLKLSLIDAIKIEQIFPKTFLWNFTGGGGIHGLAYIRYNKLNEKKLKRYGYVFDFYKAVIDYINRVTGLQLEKTFVHYRGLTRSMGSLHSKQGLHSIPIRLDWTSDQILKFAKSKFIYKWNIPDLDIKELVEIVPIVNYRFERSTSYSSTDKVPIEYEKYPPCIKTMMEAKNKGNMERFEIIRYLFNLHPKSEVYTFLKTILTADEFQKSKTEGQIEFILNRQYPAPTCTRMMNAGLCTHCGRANPAVLRERKYDNKSNENRNKDTPT